jgi:hypothetical protein
MIMRRAKCDFVPASAGAIARALSTLLLLSRP